MGQSRNILGKTTYVLRRSIRFYDALIHGAFSAPSCDNRGRSVDLPMGTKVCVAHFSLSKDRTCALMTTPHRSLGPVYGWVDTDDLCPMNEAESENIQPCFV